MSKRRLKVTDDEILEAYHRLARQEGIFCEPASAASVAGLIKAAKNGRIEGSSAVCIITGNGLKDPDTARTFTAIETEVGPSLAEIERALDI